MCVAVCGSDAECQNIDAQLSCVTGTCRIVETPPPGGTGGTILPPTSNAGAAPTLDLPPGDWSSRGVPADCSNGVVIDVSGEAPWGTFTLNETWVAYTTGSTRPEFMTIVFSGTWSDGPLVIGASISKTPESGGQLVSDDGMEVFVTRYLNSLSEQVEVEGTLTVDEYVPPADPLEGGAPLTLRGELTLSTEDWSLTAPFDIPTVCFYSPIVIK
jgi:hypothetical protein